MSEEGRGKEKTEAIGLCERGEGAEEKEIAEAKQTVSECSVAGYDGASVLGGGQRAAHTCMACDVHRNGGRHARRCQHVARGGHIVGCRAARPLQQQLRMHITQTTMGEFW